MNERIREFLRSENKSSAQFAEEIGVQPSGISHILSGRNNPSLDFILKMLEKYQFLSTEWLLFGKGSMYKTVREKTLFDIKTDDQREENESTDSQPEESRTEFRIADPEVTTRKEELKNNSNISSGISPPAVKRIVWFFENNSFEEFYPGQ